MDPKISIIIPLFNENASFQSLVLRLNQLMERATQSMEVVLVDDGSQDDTSALMQQLALTDARYQCVFLARNYGHQLALTAGFATARGTEAVMVMDGDLQDPPELFFDFYGHLQQGYDVVYAVRQKRKEPFYKRCAYHLFYRLLKAVSYVDIPLDSGDFSLISRRVVDIMNKMPEESRYIRGIRAWIGFRQIGIPYERQERIAGTPKYSLRMLYRLAYNGIFNFSEFPIKFISKMGLVTVAISLIYFTVTLVKKFFYHDVPQGFTALLFTIILFSGVQLLSLGIIGEYVLRIFFQVKNRPLFIIREKIVDRERMD